MKSRLAICLVKLSIGNGSIWVKGHSGTWVHRERRHPGYEAPGYSGERSPGRS